jgi:hypothetical protein
MRDAETTIERVLGGLRDVDAPVGMEGRVLATLEEREASRAGRSRWSWLGERPVPAMLGCGIAAAAVVAVMLVVPAVRHTRGVEPVGSVGSVETPAPDVGLKSASGNVAGAKATSERPVGSRAIGARVMKRVEVARDVRRDDSDAVAAEEMQAASCPAPPVPLTEQERLLLRVVNKRDPQQMAELDPVKRATRDAEEKAEVERFFVPERTGDSE